MKESAQSELLKPFHSKFHSYCVRPNVSFEEQIDEEEVLILTRPHPITQIPWLFNSLLFLLLLAVGNIFLPQIFVWNQIIYINLIIISFIAAYVWFNFLLWFFDVGLVTDMRVVDIDFHSILMREVNATRLESIEEATSRVTGYVEALFDFGDIFIQTAGSEQNIEFLRVPNPSRIVKIINNITQDSHGHKRHS